MRSDRALRPFANLRVRVTTLLILGVMFAGAGFDFLLVSVTRNRLREELDFRTRALLSHLVEQSATPLALGDTLELSNALRHAVQESDIVGAAFYRADGWMAAMAVRDPGLWRRVVTPQSLESSDEPTLRTVRAGEFDLRDHLEPVRRRPAEAGSAEGEASELFALPDPAAPATGARPIGWLRLVVSTERLQRAVEDTARLGLVVLLTALGLWMFPVLSLVRLVARPLREASELAREIAAGHLDRRLPVRGSDELGALAESMNTMASALDEAHRRVQAEADALRTATSAVVAIASGARLAQDPRSVFALVSAQVRRVTGCDGLALAAPDSGARLRFVNFDPAPPWGGLTADLVLDEETERAWMASGHGALRRVLDGSGDALARGLAEGGFRSVLAVPLVIEGRTTALLLLAARDREAFPESEVGLVAALASHLSAALRAAQLNERLERAFEELQRTRDHMVRSEMLRVAGEMASGVAHEFNNTLGAILGRAQLLRGRAAQGLLPAAELTASLQVIERAAQDGTETVRRLRQFGRGADDAGIEAVDLARVAREAVEFTRPRWENEAQTAGRTIRLSLESQEGSWVVGRGHELREVFVNLILNAVDALPRGGTIQVSAMASGERVLASVRDDGVGMSDEVRRHLFEPFFTTKGEQGTGLGLSLVYGILQRHGGSIRVDSRPGGGTRVELSFPLGAAGAMPGEAGTVTALPGIAPLASLHIVVVDDEPAVRDLLRDIAVALGHHVQAHESGGAALAAYRPGEADLLLTDIGMPGMSGWQLARKVRALDPVVTIAFVTGWGEEMDPEEVAGAGVDLVVSKPFTVEDVIRVTQVAVHRRVQRKAA